MSGRESHVEKLRGDLARVQRKVAALGARTQTLDVRTRRLDALRKADDDLGARLDVLASILDTERVLDSIHAAVLTSVIAEHPVQHLVIANLLPDDAYAVIVNAVPAPEFFEADGRSNTEHLLVRSAPMPVDALVTWMFVTDVVAPALAAAVMARLAQGHGSSDIRLVGPRVVRRRPEYVPPAPGLAATDAGMAVMYLARPHDTVEYGSRLHTPSMPVPLDVPFQRNSAIALWRAAASHAYAAIPRDAGELVRDTYQFGMECRAR